LNPQIRDPRFPWKHPRVSPSLDLFRCSKWLTLERCQHSLHLPPRKPASLGPPCNERSWVNGGVGKTVCKVAPPFVRFSEAGQLLREKRGACHPPQRHVSRRCENCGVRAADGQQERTLAATKLQQTIWPVDVCPFHHRDLRPAACPPAQPPQYTRHWFVPVRKGEIGRTIKSTGEARSEAAVEKGAADVEQPLIARVHVAHQRDQVPDRQTRWVALHHLQRVALEADRCRSVGRSLLFAEHSGL